MKPQYLINWWYPGDTFPVCEAKRYDYTRCYIPYKSIDTDYVYCLSDEVFYRLLDEWNRDGADWKYYSDTR